MPSELGRVLTKYREQNRQQQQLLERLYLAMIDQSEDELRSALKSDLPAKRFMAAFVVGDRRLPWHEDLIRLLSDTSDPVRQSARRGLIILSFLTLNPDEAKQIAAAVRTHAQTPLEKLTPPVDFGPQPDASKTAQRKAVEQWTEWWAKPEAAPKPSTGLPTFPPEYRVEINPERLAEYWLKAGPTSRKEIAANYRDAVGDQYTQALAIAIARAPASARAELRSVLADRFAKMTAEVMRQQLDADLPEIRRAAVLDLVRRESKAYVSRIAELLLDPEPIVQQTAHSALCKLSGQDFGPENQATEADRILAIDRWQKWWADAKVSR